MIRAVMLQFFTLFLVISILQFDPIHPLSWFWSNIELLFTPSSWFYDLIAVLATIGMGYTYGKQLTLNSWIPKNHIETFLKLFQPNIITSALAHIFAGGVLVRSYLGLYGRFNGLTTVFGPTVLKRQSYLNVPHIFLVLSGCYTGLSLWKEFHFNNKNVVQFPMIEQTGNSQLGRRISKMISKSFVQVVFQMRWFILFYFFIGYNIVDVLSELLFLEPSVSPSAYVVSNLWSVLDVILICIIVNTLVKLSIVLLRTVLCINLSRRVRFVTTGTKSITQGMISNNALLSHLAFYDFSLLTSESKIRRNDFFALSQPGGHPHNWNDLKKACLDKIGDFIKQLTDSAPQNPTNSISTAATVQEPKSQPVLYSAGRNLVTETPKTTKNIQTPQNNNNDPNDKKDSKNLLSKIPFGAYPVKALKAIKDKFSNNVFINSAPDAGVRAVFSKSQIIIWAVEGKYIIY